MEKKLKLVAHRGASLEYPCNSLVSLVNGARMGADWVECDVRRIAGGRFVIFHDEAIEHDGARVPVGELTFDELSRDCARDGVSLMPFEFLCENYREKTPILLHIKLTEADEEFAGLVAGSGLPVIAGVQSLAMLRCFAGRLPRERILAFLPRPDDASAFFRGGAGILRLWEQWLNRITPDQVRAQCPGAEVYIMACRLQEEPWAGIPLDAMDGSPESLCRCARLGADGVLLNDLAMALDWRAAQF